MEQSLIVRCPDCGDLAKRTYVMGIDAVVKTECPHCDYYTMVYFSSGEVVEAHTSCTAIAHRKKRDVLIPVICKIDRQFYSRRSICPLKKQ